MLLLGVSVEEASHEGLELPEVLVVLGLEGVWRSGWVVVGLWGISAVATNEQEAQVDHKNQMLPFRYLMTQTSSYARGVVLCSDRFLNISRCKKVLGYFFFLRNLNSNYVMDSFINM